MNKKLEYDKHFKYQLRIAVRKAFETHNIKYKLEDYDKFNLILPLVLNDISDIVIELIDHINNKLPVGEEK